VDPVGGKQIMGVYYVLNFAIGALRLKGQDKADAVNTVSLGKYTIALSKYAALASQKREEKKKPVHELRSNNTEKPENAKWNCFIRRSLIVELSKAL
jgi:hypothetical protein